MAVGTVGSTATYLIDNWATAIITAATSFGFGCSCSADGSCFSAGCCCYHFGCCACSHMPIAVIVIVAVRLVPRRSLRKRGLRGRHIFAC